MDFLTLALGLEWERERVKKWIDEHIQAFGFVCNGLLM